MEAVETAQLHQAELCGLVIDLTKAYNTLPRLPCLGIALASGVDQFTLQAWASALAGMRRRFWINGSVSAPVTSNRGLPEGCGMSCLGMLLLTQIWHEWIRCGNELHQPLSFVDNWEVICNSAGEVQKALDRTLDFAASLDISVDKAKTFTWAVRAEDRRQMQVVHDCRDLGAHVVFSLQIRNSTVTNRFRDLGSFWNKLRFVKAPYDQKVQVINTAAWPRALHAISGSLVGRKHFHALRCEACRALGFDKPGCNRFVLALLGQFDPQEKAIIQTVREWQNIGTPSHQATMLEALGSSPHNDVGKGSLTQVFVQRLHTLGWKVASNESIIDHHGQAFDLFGNWNDVRDRLQEAWLQVVAAQVSQRPSFKHFHLVNPSETRTRLKQLDCFDQGIMRNLLCGVMLTREQSYHWTEHGAHECEVCGSPDSLSHRFWLLARSPYSAWMVHEFTVADAMAKFVGWNT